MAGVWIRCAGLAAIVAVLAVPASAATVQEWTGFYVGDTFNGTYVNLTGSTVDGVSFGTGELEKNAITSFMFDGQPCPLYAGAGSAYCYEISIPPGMMVPFSGASADPIVGGKVTGCDTHDDGATNNCIDVVLATKVDTDAIATMTKDIDEAITEEKDALTAIKDGRLVTARAQLGASSSTLNGAETAGEPMGASSPSNDLKSARSSDMDASSALQRYGRKGTGRAKSFIEDALGDKKSALEALQALSH